MSDDRRRKRRYIRLDPADPYEAAIDDHLAKFKDPKARQAWIREALARSLLMEHGVLRVLSDQQASVLSKGTGQGPSSDEPNGHRSAQEKESSSPETVPRARTDSLSLPNNTSAFVRTQGAGQGKSEDSEIHAGPVSGEATNTAEVGGVDLSGLGAGLHYNSGGEDAGDSGDDLSHLAEMFRAQ